MPLNEKEKNDKSQKIIDDKIIKNNRNEKSCNKEVIKNKK